MKNASTSEAPPVRWWSRPGTASGSMTKMTVIQLDTLEQKKQFVTNDLGDYELRCLLGNAAALGELERRQAGYLCVALINASCIHARNLFNFFCRFGHNDIHVTDFGALVLYQSDVYDKWSDAIHDHVMHIRGARVKKPSNVKNVDALNEQVQVFAREALRLWDLFEIEAACSDLRHEIVAARVKAEKDAALDAEYVRLHVLPGDQTIQASGP
jgi:hypothetical protein